MVMRTVKDYMTLQKIIHNVATGEIITRDYTAAEIAEFQADKAQADKDAAAKTKADKAKAAARQAVIDKLGLTADEIAALLS
jgi:hypothetical protein